MKVFYLWTFIFGILSCETKVYKTQNDFNPSLFSAESRLVSQLNFGGISELINITDSTATVKWSEHSQAIEYHIFLLEEDTTKFFARVIAPSSEFTLTNLDNDKNYKIQVKLLDEFGLFDGNTNLFSFTTLKGPSDAITITRLFPNNQNDFILKPKFIISGLKNRETIRLFSDANCGNQVAQGLVNGSSIILESSELAPDNSYEFHVQRLSEKGILSSCSIEYSVYNLTTCPSGYVLVPSSDGIGVNEFCVMAFEARAWNDLNEDNFVDNNEIDGDGCQQSSCSTKNWGQISFNPGSTSEGLPWRMIDIETAKTECRSLGENFDLISNREWMAIAENIEANPNNWSNATISKDECLKRGNIGIDDDCSYDATSIDSSPIASRNIKAYHELSNGNEIWDFSGNLAEWVSWGNERDVTVNNFFCENSWSELSLDFCDGRLNPIDFLPRNPAGIASSLYDSSLGLGKIEGGAGGVMLRSGSFRYGEYAGIYFGSLSQSKTTARSDIGFRCVYRRFKL